MNTEVARNEVKEAARRYELNPVHTEHVTHLALLLFDGLQPLHGFGPAQRFLLEAAAHLHDIGRNKSPNRPPHHIESAQLIENYPWQTLDRPAIRRIALISRFHRKEAPYSDHPEIAPLPPETQREIQILTALLRIADGLERTHRQRVKSLRVQILPDKILLIAQSLEPVPRELAHAAKKLPYANELFDRPFVLVDSQDH